MRLAITGRLEQWPEQKPFDKRKHVPLQFIEISDTLGVTLIPALSPERLQMTLQVSATGSSFPGPSMTYIRPITERSLHPD